MIKWRWVSDILEVPPPARMEGGYNSLKYKDKYGSIKWNGRVADQSGTMIVASVPPPAR